MFSPEHYAQQKKATTPESVLERVFGTVEKHINIGPVLEMQIPAIALDDKDFFLYLNDMIDENFFQFNINKIVWNFIKKYFKKYSYLPAKEIINTALDKTDYQIPFTKRDTIDYIKEQVVETIQKQRFELFFLRCAIEKTSDAKVNYDKLFKEFKNVIYIRPENYTGLNYFESENRFDKIKQFWADRIPTGFPSLNQILPGGGFGRKEVFCFMGATGVGKSLWLNNIGASAILGGYKVLHFTRENSEELTSLRYDSIFTNNTADEVLENTNNTILKIQEILNRVIGDANEDAAYPLWIKEFPTGASTLEEAKLYTQLLYDKYGFKPDLIIDDYLDLLADDAGESRQTSEYIKLGKKFVAFRGWMVQTRIAGITATQTQRMKDHEIAKTSNVGDSLKKIQAIDGLCSINESEQDRALQQQRLMFAKNRNGEANVIAIFKIDKARMKIMDLNQIYHPQDMAMPTNTAPFTGEGNGSKNKTSFV